jgi:Sulfotransferase domain
MLPNFFVVGAQKAGTTSLHNYLYTHPEIYLPAMKETKFFVDDERYIKGISYYQAEHFSACDGKKAIGEIDPDYMYFEQALDRMASHLDLQKTKFIFVLRNPIERAFSHYLMTVRRGVEKLSFEEAIQQEGDRITRGYSARMHFSYTSRGFYLPQIQRFLGHTDKSNMLFVLSEDLKSNTMDTLTSCYRFLGISDGIVPPGLEVQHHQAKVPRSKLLLQWILRESIAKKLVRLLVPSDSMRKKLRKQLLNLNETDRHGLILRDETRTVLADRYREPNRQLGELIGRDLSHWDYTSPRGEN